MKGLFYSCEHVFLLTFFWYQLPLDTPLLLESILILNLFQFDFSFPFLEIYILNGFVWMNHKSNKKELSDIAKKIFNYKFKQGAFEIYNSASSKVILSPAQWEERCKKLLDTFYSRDGTSSGIILFPDTEITLHRQIHPVEIWQRPMITLNNWCRESSPKDATGLIIRNYDLKGHLYFRGITKNEVKDILDFNSSANMFNFQKSDTRFLVFNPSLKIILII